MDRFVVALGSGEKQLSEILQKSSKSGEVSGADAFLLYDTFGFPLEITVDAAAEQNIKVHPVMQSRLIIAQRCSFSSVSSSFITKADLPPKTL